MDARDWHRAGHHGDPSADVFLSLASVAVDESIRLHVDSAALYRALVQLDRTLLTLEDSGWTAAQGSAEALPPLPPIVAELGRNLAASCPANGVVITGSEVEWLAAWHGAMRQAGRRDLIPLRADLYATDPLYRARMASVLAVPPTTSLAEALKRVASTRPLCIAPAMGLGGMPDVAWTPLRLMLTPPRRRPICRSRSPRWWSMLPTAAASGPVTCSPSTARPRGRTTCSARASPPWRAVCRRGRVKALSVKR
jgi:hypothetical protein